MSRRLTRHGQVFFFESNNNDYDDNDYDNFRGTVRARVSRVPEDLEARHIHRLPCLASDFFQDNTLGRERVGWGPNLRMLLLGTRDNSGSPLSALKGQESTLVRRIYAFVASEWAPHVTLTIPASLVGKVPGRMDDRMVRFTAGRHYPEFFNLQDVDLPKVSSPALPYVAFASCGSVTFPEPANRNVNMMPFIFGNKNSLPEELRDYYDSCIEKCPYLQEEVGKVGYLTVHECYVDAGKAQRRDGLHIETPGLLLSEKSTITTTTTTTTAADTDTNNVPAFMPGAEHRWGCGVFYSPDKFDGGIYMASSVSGTSRVWDALVDKTCRGIVDAHGGCEHLRPFLGDGTLLEAGELIWMTDSTPHEALPQGASGYRQFFRVVTSQISHWFADHSTPNPCGVTLPSHVTVVRGNKFELLGKRQRDDDE